jgi:tetratricopeptide (TPR) repeat protein
MREAVLAGMGDVRRMRAHAAIGTELEREPERQRRPAADLAFHFAQGGDRERAVRYALEAADEAERATAFAPAAAHYRSAAALLEASAEATSLAEVLVQLGDASGRAGSCTTAAENNYRQAIDLVGQLGRGPQTAEVEHRLGTVGSALAVRVLIDLSELLAASFSRPLHGLPLLERAVAAAEGLGDAGLKAAAYRALGNLRSRAGELAVGRSLLERALALADEIGDLVQATEAAASLSNVCLWSGDVHAAEEAQRTLEQLARETQDPFQLRHVYTWMAALHSYHGEWKEADALLRRVEPMLNQLDSPEPLAFFRAMRASQRFRRGRFGEAERDYGRTIDALRRSGSRTFVWYLASRSLVLAELGQLEGDPPHRAPTTIAGLANEVEPADVARKGGGSWTACSWRRR